MDGRGALVPSGCCWAVETKTSSGGAVVAKVVATPVSLEDEEGANELVATTAADAAAVSAAASRTSGLLPEDRSGVGCDGGGGEPGAAEIFAWLPMGAALGGRNTPGPGPPGGMGFGELAGIRFSLLLILPITAVVCCEAAP